MGNGKVRWGLCVGVPGKVAPHIFFDGHLHHPGSHGLCPRCRDLTLSQLRTEAGEMRSACEEVQLIPSPR